MDHDVSSLMLGMLGGGGRDEFGRGYDPRRSLLLDTVMAGQPRASYSRLLQMPAEILADVVDLLADDRLALAALALVNSHCRQLARCCQFAEISFDYSLHAQQLFLEIANEALGGCQQLRIGTCVRRVTFASSPSRVANYHRELYESIWGGTADSTSMEQREQLRKNANEHYMKLREFSVLAISSRCPTSRFSSGGTGFHYIKTSLFKSPVLQQSTSS